MEENLYLYGVIRKEVDLSFDENGISLNGSDASVKTFPELGLSVVYTELGPQDSIKIAATRKNLITHQKVVEKVLETHSILPFKFGTVLASKEDIHDLLNLKLPNFQEELEKIEGKVEMNLKVMWNDMEQVFHAISSENIAIINLKERLMANGGGTQNDKIELGQVVEQAMETKKSHEADLILERLKPVCSDIRVNKNITDNMFLNVAILINREGEQQLDEAVNSISEDYHDTVSFKYVGPTAPFNFIS